MTSYKLPIDPQVKPVDNQGPTVDLDPFHGADFREDDPYVEQDPNLTFTALDDAFAHGGAGRERDYCPRCDTYHDSDQCQRVPDPNDSRPNWLENYKTQTVGEAHSRGCIYRQELVRLSDGAILASMSYPGGVVSWVDRDMFNAKQRIAIRKALSEEQRRWREHSQAQAKAETRAAIRSGEVISGSVLSKVAGSVSKRGTVSTSTVEAVAAVRDRHPSLCTCRLCRPDLYPRPARVRVHAGVPCFEVDELQEPR